MSVEAIIGVTILLLFIFLAIEMPVAFALGLSGLTGLVLLKNFDNAANVLGSVPFTSTASLSLTMIPMFILMGTLAVEAGVAKQAFTLAQRVSTRLPGGLGVATVMACAGFAAVSGSSVATAATMAKLSVAEMRRFGYPAHFATGIVAVAGTLGAMIPPSILLILYAVLAGESPARLMAGGILPGLISALFYIVYIVIVARKLVKPAEERNLEHELAVSAAAVNHSGRGGDSVPGVDIVADIPAHHGGTIRGPLYMMILFIIVMGGLYTGLVTATESAAVGALAALLIMIIENRRAGFRGLLKSVTAALKEAAATTSMIFAIIVGSGILSVFFVVSRVPQRLTEWVTTLDLPNWTIPAIFLLILIPMGMALESISILVITVPLMHPIILSLGYDGVWFGVLVVLLIEVGLVTPPVGISCFVVSGVTGVPSHTVFRGILPLVLVEMCVGVVLFLIPDIVMFLPSFVNQ